jgi:DeoR/GlpR family transcriptional regulator of sugar metabolism
MTDADLRYEAAAERRARILSTLQVAGFVSIPDLARELAVSHMTIRRDLHTLEGAGRLRLVHGGASLGQGVLHRADFPGEGHTKSQERVARRAAGLVGATDTIVIDAGATAYALARALPEDFGGCVITHSMPVVQLLAERRGATRLVALGGELLADRRAFVGPTTESAIAQLRARTFFLSPFAVDSRGMYARSPAEASVQRSLMDVADDVVLVSTHETFTRSAPARVAPLDRLTAIVADPCLPPEVAQALKRADVTLHAVPWSDC